MCLELMSLEVRLLSSEVCLLICGKYTSLLICGQHCVLSVLCVVSVLERLWWRQLVSAPRVHRRLAVSRGCWGG